MRFSQPGATRFALAPGCHISRRWRSVSNFGSGALGFELLAEALGFEFLAEALGSNFWRRRSVRVLWKALVVLLIRGAEFSSD